MGDAVLLRRSEVEIDMLIETLKRRVENRDKEIEVLTQERDNALLRIEELERDIARPYDFWVTRGGVNPNA